MFSLRPVTEQEIQNGILSQSRDVVTERRTLVFIRTIQGYEDKLVRNIKLAKRFFEIDSNNQIDVEATALLESLKSKLRAKDGLAESYSVDWHESDGGVTQKTHPEYFESFGQSFYDRIVDSIKACSDKKIKTTYRSQEETDLMQELLDHAYLCQKYSNKFQGRKELIKRVNEYLTAEAIHNESGSKPFVIYGESGAGKSSLMAAVANEVEFSDHLRSPKTIGNCSDAVSCFRPPDCSATAPHA